MTNTDQQITDEHLDKALAEEFAGKSQIIHDLKLNDAHFRNLLTKNHELWQEIQNIQNNVTPSDDVTLENLEKKRLVILDQISAIISKKEG